MEPWVAFCHSQGQGYGQGLTQTEGGVAGKCPVPFKGHWVSAQVECGGAMSYG